MTRLLNGKPVAEAINERSLTLIEMLNEKDITPTLAIFRIGEDASDLSYEKSAIKKCEELGVKVIKYVFENDVEEEEFYENLDRANNDSYIHGILVFRPLPDYFDKNMLRRRINPRKDVDACSNASLAGLFIDKGAGFAPCTAQSAMEILDYYDIPISGKSVTVLGRSLVIGKPISMLMINKDATVTICHTKTVNTAEIASKADILITAIGKPETIDKSYTNENQSIIDVGISWSDEKKKLCGDMKFDEVKDYVKDITPVPGGVGSVTTAVLINHVVLAAIELNGIQD